MCLTSLLLLLILSLKSSGLHRWVPRNNKIIAIELRVSVSKCHPQATQYISYKELPMQLPNHHYDDHQSRHRYCWRLEWNPIDCYDSRYEHITIIYSSPMRSLIPRKKCEGVRKLRHTVELCHKYWWCSSAIPIIIYYYYADLKASLHSSLWLRRQDYDDEWVSEWMNDAEEEMCMSAAVEEQCH